MGRKFKKGKGRPTVNGKKVRGIIPLRNQVPKPKRNALCPCGSKVKFKLCCGKVRIELPQTSPYKTMVSQYTPGQTEAAQAFTDRWGFTPNPSQLMMFMEGDHEDLQASILRGLRRMQNTEKFVYAVEKLGRLVTPRNRARLSKEVLAVWDATIIECVAAQQAAQAMETV